MPGEACGVMPGGTCGVMPGEARHEIESPKHLPQEIAQGRLPLPKTECLRPQNGLDN
jgi:hypothetical protein